VKSEQEIVDRVDQTEVGHTMLEILRTAPSVTAVMPANGNDTESNANSEVHARDGKGTGGVTNMDPGWAHSVLTVNGKMVASPESILAHELAHLVDYVRGTLDTTVNPATGIKRSEERAVMIENMVREQLVPAQPARVGYDH
jgi:hypothetical protein